eukprot:5948486-Lingulodinium_polyedra.AAC.1
MFAPGPCRKSRLDSGLVEPNRIVPPRCFGPSPSPSTHPTHPFARPSSITSNRHSSPSSPS